MRHTPNAPDDFEDALEGYQGFQQLDPKEIGVFDSLKIPSRLRHSGAGVHVLYRSDKWEAKAHNYIHDHDPGVIYARCDGDGPSIQVPGFVTGAQTLYLLGDCQGFRYRDHDGVEIDAKTQRPYPKLYAIPSGKALLVVDEDRDDPKVVCVIWGGQLDVRPEGIVG